MIVIPPFPSFTDDAVMREGLAPMNWMNDDGWTPDGGNRSISSRYALFSIKLL